MFNWIKSQVLFVSVILNIIFVLVIGAAIYYFIIVGKNIVIDRHSESTSTSISSSSSGAISIGFIGDSVKGHVVEKHKELSSIDDVIIFRQSLSVSQKLLASTAYTTDDKKWHVFYSSFEDESNEVKKVVKSINGVEKDRKTYINNVEAK